jgi:small subunit ribosomal protein S2
MPEFTMRQLLEAGVHFGHHTKRWNPKMSPFIFGVRNGIHIIDLQQTMPMLHAALAAIRETTAAGGRILFVGTKRQASELVAEAAGRSGQYFVNHRWLGGTLTNWKTITASIQRLRDLDEALETEESGLTKKELLGLTREREKLQRALGGIKEMGGLPDALFVIDTNKESIAIKEAKKLKIPVVGVIDSNSDPDGITFAIPGNDDAIRSIALYCDLVSRAVLDGLQQEAIASGSDIGESEETPVEDLPEETPVEDLPEETPVEDLPDETPVEGLPEEAPVEGLPEEAPVEGLPEEAPPDDLAEEVGAEGGDQPSDTPPAEEAAESAPETAEEGAAQA